MKSYKLIALLAILLLLGSCSKYLDKKPDNLLTEEQIWETRANAEAYLYNVYGYIHYANGDDYASVGASDETSVAIPTTAVRQMVGGSWSPADWHGYYWSGWYTAIRKTFVFEENIDRVPANQLSNELKQQYKGENYFLRGYYYWLLLRQYGPFVNLTQAISQNENFNVYPRAPFDTCVATIVGLMNKASALLPGRWDNTANLGRANKGICMAIKAKVMQLAASPLWNGNPAFAGFKNQDGTNLASASYDVNRWRLAAAAAKAVIDSGFYRLYTNLENGDTRFNPYLSVRNVHLTPWNVETIFGVVTWNTWGYTKCVSPGPGGYNMYNATQNVVDAFAMNNGRTIDDPASGYTETGFVQQNGANDWEQKQGDWSMYANREPRFYAFIAYNGRSVLPARTVDDKNFFSSDNNLDGRGRIEFYYNGKSGQKSAGTSNITGYLPLKRVSPNDNIRQDAVSNPTPYIVLRYAEILLDYVEALNESDPGNPDIPTYLDMVRARAGLPGIATVYPDAVGNTEKMRKHILRERQVELCFEGDRYFTLVRRLLLGNPENQTIYGLNTYANDNGQGFAFTDFYKRTLFQKRTWDNRMYLFPIQQQDIERDRALVQNPGW
ncbi:RagB/SusD family nutrient uptake outer membrane protein [Chitinophaga sp. sic0106]|uniref:RagB/SusD family nutrient uptake outer membrane protein n=1 Tax=Chitinophaga sp. sic0106 TaxID=2854785 RepID=UPI001C47839F|nr:RagB/SusD family nutrient uptake outer membrane protein [Chitinophaga sp. sic0106]MBV7529696.1 RagB/SusD family nutrient uptake outer membrane protein [Chitinophaga sp. sic0106]